MREKGQVILFDLAIAIMVFLILFIFLNQIWVDNLNALQQQDSALEIQFKAVQVAEMLVTSPGKPANWHLPAETPVIIGLAEKNNILNQAKLNAFAAEDYNTLKELMQIKNMDFFFRLSGAQDLNVGRLPPTDASVVSVERIATLNGREANVRFSLFRKE